LSHDLWVNVVRGGHANETEQLKVARFATMMLGALAIVLGILFKGQNVAYMVGLRIHNASPPPRPRAAIKSCVTKKNAKKGSLDTGC
jgi:phosphate/sulfate permease